jgi:hypothetical protein
MREKSAEYTQRCEEKQTEQDEKEGRAISRLPQSVCGSWFEKQNPDGHHFPPGFLEGGFRYLIV